MYVLLLIALLVFGVVAHAHGFLIGLAAGIGTLAILIGLLLLLGRSAARRPAPAPYTSPGPAPEVAMPASADVPANWEAVAPRSGDRTLPRDHLPYPLGGGVTAHDGGVPPGLLGRECYLLPLRIDLGATPYCWSWRAAKWLEGEAAREVFVAQLYDRLRAALAEPGGDTAPPVGEDDLTRHRFALEGMPIFLAFRSRDARWGGFMLGEASFRFPLERLAGLHLRIGRPARGSGGYDLCIVLTDGDERTRFLETHLAYEPRTTTSLLIATMQLGRLFDVRVGGEEYMDDSRGFDPDYDR